MQQPSSGNKKKKYSPQTETSTTRTRRIHGEVAEGPAHPGDQSELVVRGVTGAAGLVLPLHGVLEKTRVALVVVRGGLGVQGRRGRTAVVV